MLRVVSSKALYFFVSIIIRSRGFSVIDCTDASAPFTGMCASKWNTIQPSLKPSQSNVGYAWVQYKVDKDFSTKDDAQKNIDDEIVPGVRGPDNFIYVVDHHHTLCALDYSGFQETVVTIDIICDKSNLSTDDFWSYMVSNNFVFLETYPTDGNGNSLINALPVAMNATDLPSSFFFSYATSFSFADDPWRSVAGLSRKVKTAASPSPSCGPDDYKYCERCMYRGCDDGYQTSGPGVDYFEFKWSYFFIDATYYQTDLWPSLPEWQTFKDSYEKLASPSVMGKIDSDAWSTLATFVISLCRGDDAGKYSLPQLYGLDL